MVSAVVSTSYEGPSAVAVIEVDPVAPGEGEVVVAVRAAALNPFDIKMTRGAAGTDPARVAVHCVHQHTAPCADEDAHRLLDGAPAHLTSGFLDGLRARAGEAVAEAVRRLEPVDRVGCGAAPVECPGPWRQ